MSSEMFVFDEAALYQHLGPSNMLSPEISGNFFTDSIPLSALSDSSIDSLLQEISSDEPNPNTTTTQPTARISPDEAQSLDQIAQTLFTNSPPSHQLETLSLSQQQQEQQQQQQQQTHLGNLPNSCNLASGFNDYPVSDAVKTEDFHLGFDSPSYNSYLLKFMQRSYSSNSFEGKPSFLFQPRFDTLLEDHNFQGMGSPEIETGFSSNTGSHIRRVCSTGDLPEVRMNTTTAQVQQGGCFGGEGNYMEEGNFKVGKYSAEERKERIDRYRAKRTQRNFNKTIKYACRKTLADNRPRIRGRFARNDESGEIPKPTCYNRYEDEDDLWQVDNLQEEDEEGILGTNGGRFLSNFGGTHFQYCGY